jgi:MraZ protein
VYLSNFDRQLDAKRRIVLPVEFRAAAAAGGAFDQIFCFPSVELDCIDGGGEAYFKSYEQIIDDLPRGDPVRTALETSVIGEMFKLSCDPAGRITLPEPFCDLFGITDWVTVVGMRDHFQIWSKDAYAAHRERQRAIAREGLAARAAEQRRAKLAAAS